MAEILKTLRSVRVGGFAVFDFASAFAGMYYLAPHIGLSHKQGLLLTIPTGIAVHQALGIETPLNKMVLGKEPNRIAQGVAAGSLLLALFSD